MAGNKEGAKKAARTNEMKYGSDYYKIIGARSWQNVARSHVTGFALDPELAREAGRKGGKKTKNEYKTNLPQEETESAETLHEIFKDSGTGSL